MPLNEKIRLVLLPGLHGTGGLLQQFLKECPPNFDPLVITYPGDRRLSYDDLEKLILARVKESPSKLIILGESYSGALALRLASRYQERVLGVILVATFVTSPAPAWFRFLPWESIFLFSIPLYAMRALLSRSKEKSLMIKQISSELKRSTPTVLAWRVNEALRCDARDALRACPAPILYLYGKDDKIISRKCLDTIGRIRRTVVCRHISAPHFLLLAAPTDAWIAITEFVDRFCTPPPDA